MIVGFTDTVIARGDPGYDEARVGWRSTSLLRRGPDFAALRPFLAGGAYSNFVENDDEDPAGAVYGTTLTRLAEVKARYDPDNVLSPNQNIRPALVAS